MARRKRVLIAKRSGVVLRQTFEKEGRSLKQRAGSHAQAKQYRRLHRVLKHQPTIVGRVMRDLERRLLKRRQAVEPVTGHLKDNCGLRRNWLKGSEGDVLHPVLYAAGHNLRWLMRAVVGLGLKALFALCVLVGMLGRVVSDNAAWPPGRRLEADN